jgi:D-arginine dehydrogenase
MSSDARPVVVIGGGIAGLAAAWQLAAHGLPSIVLEAEPLLGMHATARNAAIFLPLEHSGPAIWLAARSRVMLDERLGGRWLSACGVALVARDPGTLTALQHVAHAHEVLHERWTSTQVEQRLPLLATGDVHDALFLPGGGIMDTHAIVRALERWGRSAGVQIRTSARVASLVVDGGDVRGVLLEDGSEIESSCVVLAAGAWAGAIGRRAGAPLELTPLRRHLVVLDGAHVLDATSPVVWRVDDAPCYLRPESGRVLASPCDETPWSAEVPSVDAQHVEQLAARLLTLAPAMADAGVVRAWACLRTMTVDREPAIGKDPRLRGLWWIAGLGGRGMTGGVAAGELLAHAVLEREHPLIDALAPSRLL